MTGSKLWTSIPVLSARIARAWSELRQNKLRHSVERFVTRKKFTRQMGPFPVDCHQFGGGVHLVEPEESLYLLHE